jgi:hypothetical protein
MVSSANWTKVSTDIPAEEILIWSGGRCVVAVLVSGSDENGEWKEFMDARTDDLLEWPTHWMPLPGAPEASTANPS